LRFRRVGRYKGGGGFLRYAATSAWRFGESACALLQEARVAAPINDHFAPLGLHPLATGAINPHAPLISEEPLIKALPQVPLADPAADP